MKLQENKEHGSYMAKPQMYRICDLSKKIYDMMPEGQPLEDWMESKIAVMADSIESIYSSLKYDYDKGQVEHNGQDKRKMLMDRVSDDYYNVIGSTEPTWESFHSFFTKKFPNHTTKVSPFYKHSINRFWDDNEHLEEYPESIKDNAYDIAVYEYSKPCKGSLRESKLLNEAVESFDENTVILKEGYIPEDVMIQLLAESIKGEQIILEAEYMGKTVQLNKPKRGGPKKFYVYVNSGKKTKKGKVKAKKVVFGDKNMEIKRDNPKNRKGYRARHRCKTAKDNKTAKYWSCRFWSSKNVSDLTK